MAVYTIPDPLPGWSSFRISIKGRESALNNMAILATRIVEAVAGKPSIVVDPFNAMTQVRARDFLLAAAQEMAADPQERALLSEVRKLMRAEPSDFETQHQICENIADALHEVRTKIEAYLPEPPA